MGGETRGELEAEGQTLAGPAQQPASLARLHDWPSTCLLSRWLTSVFRLATPCPIAPAFLLTGGNSVSVEAAVLALQGRPSPHLALRDAPAQRGQPPGGRKSRSTTLPQSALRNPGDLESVRACAPRCWRQERSATRSFYNAGLQYAGAKEPRRTPRLSAQRRAPFSPSCCSPAAHPHAGGRTLDPPGGHRLGSALTPPAPRDKGPASRPG